MNSQNNVEILDAVRMNASDVDNNRTGYNATPLLVLLYFFETTTPSHPLHPFIHSIVRHFKQKNTKGAAEIAAAIDEAKESQALSLVSHASYFDPDPLMDVSSPISLWLYTVLCLVSLK